MSRRKIMTADQVRERWGFLTHDQKSILENAEDAGVAVDVGIIDSPAGAVIGDLHLCSPTQESADPIGGVE